MSNQSNPPPHGEPPRLLEHLRDAIRRRHYSYRTEQAYVHWARRFILFHGKRHPRDLGSDEVTAFLTHLARERGVSASTQNQALGDPLSLQRGARHQAALDGRHRACETPRSRSRGAHTRGGARAVRAARGNEVADGGTALRSGVAAARVCTCFRRASSRPTRAAA